MTDRRAADTMNLPEKRENREGNLLHNKHDIYRLYGGVRYALTYFKYDLKGPDIGKGGKRVEGDRGLGGVLGCVR